ncbi:MAG: 3-hydroxyacyl-CoA dehydrogenase PaaH [Burkholderiaceae bacterium]
MSHKALETNQIIAVIGSGAMGAGIAQVAAVAGHPVLLMDIRPQAAANAIAAIVAQLEKLAEKGKMSPEAVSAAASRLVAVDQLADLTKAALVIEAIAENLDAKRGLFKELESIVGTDCIFSTNSSSISITSIAAVLAQPQRLLGMHFFNPAPLMKLVEVISGLATDAGLAETVAATARAWGKTAVHAKSTPGFIVNRVARPYYAEALRVLQEGASDPATIDACFREAGGFRMGPFELMDLIGHDVNLTVTKSVWNSFYHDPRFLPSLIQQELVDAGFLGRKSGRGFFDYQNTASKPAPQTEAVVPLSAPVTLFGDSDAAVALAARISAAGLSVVRKAQTDGRLAEAGDAVIFVTDGRTATRRAFDARLNNIVLIDLALDYSQATRLAVSFADQCTAIARQQAIGFLQAAGLQVSLIADVPGLLLMRTVAMLANEAADAVNQGVCSVAGADAAMKLGVNYPRGPLCWADQIGLPRLLVVLNHLCQTYGEDRYRVSPLIQRQVFAGKKFHD